jgi:hypothetical protein
MMRNKETKCILRVFFHYRIIIYNGAASYSGTRISINLHVGNLLFSADLVVVLLSFGDAPVFLSIYLVSRRFWHSATFFQSFFSLIGAVDWSTSSFSFPFLPFSLDLFLFQ